MRIIGRIVVAIVALGCIAYAYAYRIRHPDLPIPRVDSYRIADFEDAVFGEMLSTSGGKVAIIAVDYQGPKEWVEIVLENWEGPTLVSTETLLRMKFGSDKYDRIEGGISRSSGPAFTHLRQVYSISLDELSEVLPDGRNAFAKIAVSDPDEGFRATTHTAIVRLTAAYNLNGADGHVRTKGSTALLSQQYQSGIVVSDSEPSVIWRMCRFDVADPGRDPPYREGATVSRMLFRLMEK